ncbi:DUF2478 domain-containing protein [Pseudohalocynthiibacter aestuariivivens]|nr:DUF2478 domain-containing protein [Pseudohalocynthiibacter aestuariivivens]QIE47188.1 DUF2478 domain-containing protein [Pseudohalocynthiibacter aestuariivivens]
MKIAYVMTTDKGATDRLLTTAANAAIERGHTVAGVVQSNTPRPRTHRCDMDVQVLPKGPIIRISQDLGPEASGCALDPAALEQAVVEVQKTLVDGADLLIVNKFGKHEAAGRGFRPLIAEALSQDVPVLVGLNPLNRAEFEAFAEGGAQELSATTETLAQWIDTTCLAAGKVD